MLITRRVIHKAASVEATADKIGDMGIHAVLFGEHEKRLPCIDLPLQVALTSYACRLVHSAGEPNFNAHKGCDVSLHTTLRALL